MNEASKKACLDPGSLVGPYRIVELLGAGGMGQVYRAVDTRLQREVALKLLLGHLRDEDILRRFQREARLLASLSHPNIVTIFDVSTDEKYPYVITELLKGRTLRAEISQGHLSWERASEVGIQIAEGLSAAHAGGVVHRDIKPDNIFITSDNRVKILDFGIAKGYRSVTDKDSTRAEGPPTTKDGFVLGTSGYMSPEQVKGDPPDARSDIFSFGCLLYESASGRRPFQKRSAYEEMSAVLRDAPTPLRSENAAIPAEFAGIVNRCLEKNPKDRYQSALQIAQDLRHLLAVAPQVLPALVETADYSNLPVPATTVSPAVVEPRDLAVKVAGSGVRRALLLVAAGALAVGATWWLTSRIAQEQRPKPQVQATVRSERAKPPKFLVVIPSEFIVDTMEVDPFLLEITARLSLISGLRVMSPYSALWLDSEASDRRIRNFQGVDALIRGGGRSNGAGLANLTMTDPVTGRILWQGNHEVIQDSDNSSLTKVFEMQSDIAAQISHALGVTISEQEMKRLKRIPTTNHDAYQEYLKGLEGYYFSDPTRIKTAADCFRAAIEKDPDFSEAYSLLAQAEYILLPLGEGRETLGSLIELSQKALSLDSQSAQAHLALGRVYSTAASARADEQLKLALELDPSSEEAAASLGQNAFQAGRLDDALRWFSLSLRLNPSNPYLQYEIAWTFFGLDELGSAKAHFEEYLRQVPSAREGYLGLIAVDISLGANSEAAKRIDASKSLFPSDPDVLVQLSYLQLILGSYQDARQLLGDATSLGSRTEFKERADVMALTYFFDKAKIDSKTIRSEGVQTIETRLRPGRIRGAQDAAFLAALCSMQGDRPEAYRWLRLALENGWVTHRFAEKDPLFDVLRDDPEFSKLIAEAQARVASMRKKASAKGLLNSDASHVSSIW